MLDYTQMLLEATKKDITQIGITAKYATQGFYIVYLIYALIAGAGLWYINAPLLALSIAYLIYDIHCTNHQKKTKRKKAKRLYTRIKQVIKFFPLAISLYNLCLTLEKPNIFALLATAFTLISWLLAFIFDVLSGIIERRFNLFMEAIRADFDEAIKPLKETGNFLKRIVGKDVTPPAPSKERAMLDEQIVEFRERKAERKEQTKKEKREQKKAKFQEIANKLRSKKIERKLLQSAKKITKAPDVPQLPAPKDDEDGDEE